MSSLSRDTTDEAAEAQRAIWRAMSREQRFRRALEFSSLVREIGLSGARSRHPEYDERQLKLAWLRMSMGDAAFEQLFPGENVKW